MDFELLCLTFALATSQSASQILTVTPPCIEADRSVTLKCKTNDFSSSVIFRLDGNSKGGCSSGTCLTGVVGYTPTQSGSYTEMAITAYNHSRDGGNWTCEYGGTPSDVYTVELGDCSVDNECGWCKIHCDEDIGCIFCIVLGGYFGILIIIIIVLVLCGWDLVDACMLVCCILCCIICFCKQDRKRDPESNNADGLHSASNNADGLYYQCCIRGGQYSKQNLTCLSFDGKVANKPTNDNGQQPHTGRNMEKKRPLPAIGERH